MFYEESIIENLLKCQQCGQKFNEYDQPRILPCGKTICNNCIVRLKHQSLSNAFKCSICSTEHNIPENGFIINEIASNLMLLQPKEVYRSEQCEQLKLNLKNLTQLVQELTFDMNNGIDKIKYHCSELRRLVQLSTEEKIQEINNHNDLFIKQIDSYESERINEYTTNEEFKQELNEVIIETNTFLDEKSQYLAQSQITEDKIRKSIDTSQSLKTKIEEHLCKAKIKIFNDILIEFETNKSKVDGQILGTINYKQLNINCNKAFSGSFDKSIKGWDLITGECIKSLAGHTDNVLCLSTLSSNRLISGSGEGSIKIWNLETDDCFKTINAHTKRIRCIQVISSDRILSCSDDKTIKLWDLTTGSCIRTLEGHSSEIYCIDKISNERLVSCSNDKTIKVWDLNTGECIKTLIGHEGPVYCVQKLTSEKIVSCSDDRTIKEWDLNTGDYTKTLKGHTNWVWCIKVLSIEQIVSGSGDKTIKIWDLNSSLCIRTLSGHFGSVRCIYKISHDKCISCSDDKFIKIWNLNNGECLKTIRGHSDIVWCLELPK